MRLGDRKITLEGILRLVGDELEVLFPLTKSQGYYNYFHPKFIYWEDYFPAIVKRKIGKLERQGLVEKCESSDGWVVKITEKGRNQILHYDLIRLEPKEGKQDGKWRLVFFDIEEIDRRKRDRLRTRPDDKTDLGVEVGEK